MSQRLLNILMESFPKILLPGLTMTIPLTVISFSLALVIAVIAAMVQFANVKVFKQIARFYIWVVRGTPLLVQLYVIFYGLPNLGIMLEPFPSAGLRQHDAAHDLPPGHAHAVTGFQLALGHAFQRTAHGLGAVGTLVEGKGDGRPCARQCLPSPTRSSA